MNPTNEQELDEILTKLENAVALNIGSQGMRGEAPKRSHWKAKAAIQAHTNAEIARVLDRLEQDDAKLTDGRRLELDIPSWVEAERAKLKEVK